MEQNKGTMFQQPPDPPLKRARLDVLWEVEREEERRFMRMKDWHITQAMYENAMNLIKESQTLTQSSIEDEAVTMAIRSHGLTCGPQNFSCRVEPTQLESFLSFPDRLMNDVAFDSTSADDILSQAVSVAIYKKGLGAVDR